MTDQSVGERRKPVCPMCGNGTFRQEGGKIDSQWGITAHKVLLLVCERCSYVVQFYEGNTIFDFD